MPWGGVEITNVREFAALESSRAAFRVWKRAGGSILDQSHQTRIEDIKQRFSPQMGAAYNVYVLSTPSGSSPLNHLSKSHDRFRGDLLS